MPGTGKASDRMRPTTPRGSIEGKSAAFSGKAQPSGRSSMKERLRESLGKWAVRASSDSHAGASASSVAWHQRRSRESSKGQGS